MLEEYRTIYQGGEGELIEKKSRFIATVRLVKSEEEALAFIEEMRKKYWNATHNCFAYVIGERKEIMRCSDDGDPRELQENRCWMYCSEKNFTIRQSLLPGILEGLCLEREAWCAHMQNPYRKDLHAVR